MDRAPVTQERKPDAATARTGMPVRAVVCASGMDTEYVRAGRGEPIVLVVGDLDVADVQEMIAVLARQYLILAASPTVSATADVSTWLRGFLEGLGVGDAHVLLHASHAAASELALGQSRSDATGR